MKILEMMVGMLVTVSDDSYDDSGYDLFILYVHNK